MCSGLRRRRGAAAVMLIVGALAACDGPAGSSSDGGALPGWMGGGGESSQKQPETQAISTETPTVSTMSDELPPPLPEKRGKFKALAIKAGAGGRPAASVPAVAAPEPPSVKTASATGSTEAVSEAGGFPQLGRLFSGLGGSDSVTSAQSPVLVYAALAHEIKRCWLAPDAPRLPNHIFQADASTKRGGSAKITIYEKREGVRFGPEAFTISIEPQSGGSTINSENARLPSDMGGALQQDLARWSKGQEGCAS
jgi:hypothetical protein